MLRKLAILPALVIMLSLAAPSGACVGKSLVIGSINSPDTTTISEMLGILITERTGTTVVLKYFDSYKGLAEAMKKGEVDIMVDYTGRCYTDVLGLSPDSSAERSSPR